MAANLVIIDICPWINLPLLSALAWINLPLESSENLHSCLYEFIQNALEGHRRRSCDVRLTFGLRTNAFCLDSTFGSINWPPLLR